MPAKGLRPSQSAGRAAERPTIEHPLIVPDAVEGRAYQLGIARSALKESTLVVLPTGMGKTIVALLVLVEVLRWGVQGRHKVVLVAPTKPLVEQHANSLRNLRFTRTLLG